MVEHNIRPVIVLERWADFVFVACQSNLADKLEMVARIPGGTKRVTLGGDRNYDPRDFVSNLREAAVTPHVAKNQHARRTSAIDERTTRHGGYAISQRKRKRVL
jgi:hypothetical protein